MADAAQLKQLKIKTGVVKRMIKEYQSYQKQVKKDEEKAATLKAEAKTEDDEYLAKKAEEVAKETINMVRDAKCRLTKAVGDLQTVLESTQFSEECGELKEANENLESANQIIAA